MEKQLKIAALGFSSGCVSYLQYQRMLCTELILSQVVYKTYTEESKDIRIQIKTVLGEKNGRLESSFYVT
ncbi:hypothetical protein PHJA_002580900 [Phtheirospermum japonicum]|uniref:Uncharacterized protein n=1 Tax=Phtheirospermum japonicum TaxID=374723 RepID=A0A830CZ56_9LAMI|nr:hypothetical protein PHJA_002580900 [Phtheirospermum japonicum]